MIDWIVSFALRKRLVVAMICVFVGVYGYYSWTQLAVEAYPDVADTESQVITTAPGLAAEEVEQQVTIPLERELNGTPGMTMMRSRSTFGLSLITLQFRDGIEDYWSRQRIEERIQNATLPPNLSPSLDPLSSPTGQILYYILQSDTKNLRELSEIQQWTVIPTLKQVPGVADVSNFGGLTTQYELELDPQQLMRFNIALSDITDAISNNNANAGGSVLNRGELGYVIRGIGLVQTLDDLGNIVVTQHNGTPILVRDLGKLKLSNQERHGVVGQDDKNDVVEGTVLLLRHENPSQVLDGVHAKIAELNERLKADDVQIVPYLDRTNLVNSTIDKVGQTVFSGIGLVLIVLILFLGSPRSALIVGITVPFAMTTAFILMYHAGISANLLSLGAIDFGIIVDGAIVMTDAILRRREAKPNEPLTEVGRSRRGLPGGAADLLFDRDHRHDLSAAVCLPARRSQAVLSDGLCGGLRAARRAGVRASGGAGPGLRGVSPAAPRLPQLRSRVDRAELSRRLGRLAAPSGHRLSAGGRRGHCRGDPRRHGVA